MPQKNTFDYVIVGGGSAGCVLANRLSANPNNRVCLLEAGPNDWLPFIRMPSGIIPMVRSKVWNWSYWTRKEKRLAKRKMFWPRGKTLGGSSAINAMVATRGHPDDYNDWRDLGCENWSFDDCLPYFRRMENFEQSDEVDMHYHGINGPLNVADLRWSSKIGSAFVEAGQQAGYPYNNDFTGADYYGVGPYRVYQKDGKRCSNAQAYLTKAVRKRNNLTIITKAQATHLLFDKTEKNTTATANPIASGVEYAKSGTRHNVYANKEVILCGGTVNSPQLLLLSGIGDKDELKAMGVRLRHHLPGVGENLQDHLDISIIIEDPTKSAVSLHPWYMLTRGLIGIIKYIFGRQGELTSNIAEAGGFIKTSDDEERADIQIHVCNVIEKDHGQDLRLALKKYGYTIRLCDLRPLSRGKISLASRDPLDHAKIEARYGSHQRDIDKLVTAINKARAILNQPAMQPYVGEEIEPGTNVDTDEKLRRHIVRNAESIYHPVGTCKMGDKADQMAVVDAKLRVHGVNNLRVVDASIMPTLVGGNTNGPTTMIAERAADFILDSHKS